MTSCACIVWTDRSTRPMMWCAVCQRFVERPATYRADAILVLPIPQRDRIAA
jgi:hypothetical protein